MIDKIVRNVLFNDVHKSIHESAESVIEMIHQPAISYPPNVELSSDELSALASLKLPDSAKSALQKLITSACAEPMFHWFSLLDGVTDPEIELNEIWLGATVEQNIYEAKTAHDEKKEVMLHDEFYESFWFYIENRS